MNNKQLIKGTNMKKAMVIREEEKTSFTQILGGLMIGFAILSFGFAIYCMVVASNS